MHSTKISVVFLALKAKGQKLLNASRMTFLLLTIVDFVSSRTQCNKEKIHSNRFQMMIKKDTSRASHFSSLRTAPIICVVFPR